MHFERRLKTLKQKIFEDTLQSPYDAERFLQFVREFFTGIEIPSVRASKPSQNFSEHIKEFYSLGKQNGIAVLAVNLNPKTSVDRARSVQRNFVKSLIENYMEVDECFFGC